MQRRGSARLPGDLSVLAARIARHSHRPSLTGQGPAEAEIAQVWEARRERYHAVADLVAQVWEARRERYHAVADLTYDVSAQSRNEGDDLRRKAAGIHRLLRQTRTGFAVRVTCVTND